MRDRTSKLGRLIRQAALVLPPLYSLTFCVAYSYPEYQQFVEKHSHRTVNCAMCHVNENGPIGDGRGQLNSLTPDEINRLNKARTAMEPGTEVDSPILNEFGNEIVKVIGMKKFIEFKDDPAKLPEALGNKSDLDDDGIPDAVEYLDGTDPLNKFHGDPVKLFWINLDRCKTHVILAVVAVLAINYGLMHLIQGISTTTSKPKEKE